MLIPNDSVKVLKCIVCGKDVNVNVNYPIESVTCTSCHQKGKEAKIPT